MTPVYLSPNLLRWLEILLVAAVAVAMAELVWKALPGPARDAGPGATGRAMQLPVDGGRAGAAPAVLSPALLSLFGQTDRSVPVSLQHPQNMQETQLDLTLKGILASRSGNRKLALIARGGAAAAVFRIGDRVAAAEIVRIDARRVILARNGATEALTLETALPRRGASYARRAPAGSSRPGEHERVVSRNLLDRHLQRLPELLHQARATPYWDRNGNEAGFRVVAIEAGSVFEQLGLRQEDIILTVNGVSVRNNREALAAYQSFKATDALQLGLLRNGQSMTVDFSIQ